MHHQIRIVPFDHHIILKVFYMRQKYYHLLNNANGPKERRETGPNFTEW